MNRNVPLTAAVVFVVLLLVGEAVALVIVLSVKFDTVAAVQVKEQGEGRSVLRGVAPERSKWQLLLPFRGLAANGRFADASGWVLWLTNADPGQVKPDDLAAAARKFRFAPTTDGREGGGWRWWVLRELYAFAGTDWSNVLVLSVLYALGWHAIAGFRGRRVELRRLRDSWDPAIPEVEHRLFGGPVAKISDFAEVRRLMINGTDRDLMATPPPDPLALLPHRLIRAAADALLTSDPHTANEYFRNRARETVESDDHDAAELDYFAQAIPPLGFIGTVLGIGEAMIATRKLAAGGGLSEVASALGVAFNTTFVALALFLCVEYLAMKARQERATLVDSLGRYFWAALFARINRRRNA